MPNRSGVKIPPDVEVVMLCSLLHGAGGRWDLRVSGRNLEREEFATLVSFRTRREAFAELIATMRKIYAADEDDAPGDISGIPTTAEGNA